MYCLVTWANILQKSLLPIRMPWVRWESCSHAALAVTEELEIYCSGTCRGYRERRNPLLWKSPTRCSMQSTTDYHNLIQDLILKITTLTKFPLPVVRTVRNYKPAVLQKPKAACCPIPNLIFTISFQDTRIFWGFWTMNKRSYPNSVQCLQTEV